MGDVMNNAIARLKSNDPTLTTLNLDGNNIGDSGANAIACALQTNNVLTTLVLWSNDIGDAGASAIADALRTNNALTTFDLRWNDIGSSGASAIADALLENGMITSFSPESDVTKRYMERNKNAHSRALAAAIAVAGIRRFRIPGIPVELFRQMAGHVWYSRRQDQWW